MFGNDNNVIILKTVLMYDFCSCNVFSSILEKVGNCVYVTVLKYLVYIVVDFFPLW